MSSLPSQITGISIVYSTICSGAVKENIKALRHWPLGGEFLAQKVSNAEKVSIWWRHHDTEKVYMKPPSNR